ncbi:MAG: hypothetical protein KKH52_04540 [Nanoarchaeota archaeon]|nr:hypothetical protein [Nanoarchaeota archaeon]MBU1622684.1 hypothetical protein [Nanoarchaeota archaeon]MBU1974634.1 hypothetical protein [Nanoarchaeota archaeon]
MQKKTKKKLAKMGKKVGKGVLKLIFVYPAKGVWHLVKKGVKKTKEKKERIIVAKKKPQGEAKYDQFKELRNKKGKLTTFTNKLHANKSTIGLILGARGTGKSAIGMRLLENFKAKTSKKIYALGFKEESLPAWINVVGKIEEIQNNSVILIDEGGIEFSSRKSMSNANNFLSELLLIARHKDLSVIFITQNSANLEINAIRQADYLVMKPSSLLQKDFERKKIKEIYSKVQSEFDELIGDKGLTYLYANNYLGFISNSLPSFWSEKVSKGYAKR